MFGGGGVSGGGGNGLPGAPGKSAYQVALDNGFVGTQSEWLATLDGVDGAPGPQGVPGDVGRAGDPGPKGLDGEDAYHLAIDDGFAGTLTDWLASIKGDKGDKGDVGDTGPDGLSAYQIAVAGGFTGTQDVWLTTLKGADGAQGPRGFQGDKGDTGAPGADGASAYAVALDNGFVGTEAQWLLSIHGADGAPGRQGDVGQQGPVGPAGTDGINGKSAYELAVTGGFSGTQDQWLASLKGADGAKGDKGDAGIAGADGVDGESAYQLAIGEGFVGTLSDWLNSLKGADGAQGPQGIQGQQGFQGQQGTPGINGNSVLNGTTAPATGVGNDGDFYINKTTNVIYGPKAAGAWPTGGTALVGPQGPQGVQGVQGTAGTNGNTLLNGSGSPVAATGRDGDFYLDTNTETFYGPKAAGAWPSTGTPIVGPQGPQGVQGTQGAAGSDGVNGKTAYELAVSQGYAGTLSDWLASLQGATGAQGPQGPAGVVAAGTHGDVTVAADSTFTVLRAGTLTTARNINGVAFDGSASITINAVDATAREPAIGAGTVTQYWRGDKSWQTLNSSAVGLGNVNNTADAVKIVASAGKLTTPRNINGVAFDGSADITINAVDATPRIATSLMGVANGVATLDGNGFIPSSQLPSYVDDVLEFANLAAFPTTGETGKIYIADDTNFEYRWTGTQYFRIVSSPGTTDALTEGTSNLYFTTARAIASPLTGLSQTNVASISATDTILSAIGKLGYRAFTLIPANYAQLAGAAFTGAVSVANNTGFLLNDTLGGQAGLIYDNANTLKLYASSNTGSAINILTVNGRVASPTLSVVVPLSVTGTIAATGVISSTQAIVAQSTMAVRGGGTGGEGGQLVLGYGNNLATGVSAQANNTWNIDVDATNNLRVFNQRNDASIIVALKIDEATGNITTTGGITVPGAVTTNGIDTVARDNAQTRYMLSAGDKGWRVIHSATGTVAGGLVFQFTTDTFATSFVNSLTLNNDGSAAFAGNLTVNAGRTVVGIGTDGGLEIGNYLDFHNPTADGVDYKARIQAGADGSLTVQPTNGTLSLVASSVWVGGGQNLLVQHDGTNGYIRTAAAKGHLYLGAGGANVLAIGSGGNVTLQQNGKSFSLLDASGTTPSLVCQTDNNIVLYSTTSTGANRAVFSIFARSDTATLNLAVDTNAATVNGNFSVRGASYLTLNHDGSNGYIQSKTGTLALGANGNNSLWFNTDGTITTGYNWTCTNTFSFTAAGNQMILKNGTASNPSLILRNDGSSFYLLKTAAGTAPSGAWDTTRPFTLNLTTGDISMSQNLAVSGTGTFSNIVTTNGSNGGFWMAPRDNVSASFLFYNNANVMRLWNGAADVFTVDNNGRLTAQDMVASRGDASGVIYLGNQSQTGGGRYLYYDTANYILNGAGLTVGGNLTSTSDRRLKQNIRPLEDTLDRCNALEPVRFEMKAEPGVEQIGLIAQDVEELFPEVVVTDQKGFKSVDYGRLSVAALGAIKVLTARIEALEAAR